MFPENTGTGNESQSAPTRWRKGGRIAGKIQKHVRARGKMFAKSTKCAFAIAPRASPLPASPLMAESVAPGRGELLAAAFKTRFGRFASQRHVCGELQSAQLRNFRESGTAWVFKYFFVNHWHFRIISKRNIMSRAVALFEITLNSMQLGPGGPLFGVVVLNDRVREKNWNSESFPDHSPGNPP